MVDEKSQLLQSSVYLSVEDVKTKKSIETATGFKINNSMIWRQGLNWYKEKYLAGKVEISQ